MAKVNFTPEHQAELDALLLKGLYEGWEFQGVAATKLNVNDLLNNVTIKTLENLHSGLVTQLDGLKKHETTWNQEETEQRKKSILEKRKQLIFLLIGFKRYQAQVEDEKAETKRLLSDYNKLVDEQKTPADRLKEMAEALKARGVEMAGA
jgi:histidyl-tRNA synthetase